MSKVTKRPRGSEAAASSTVPAAQPAALASFLNQRNGPLLNSMIPFLTNKEASAFAIGNQQQRSYANKLNFACLSSPRLLDKTVTLVKERAADQSKERLKQLSLRMYADDMVTGEGIEVLQLVANEFTGLEYLELCVEAKLSPHGPRPMPILDAVTRLGEAATVGLAVDPYRRAISENELKKLRDSLFKRWNTFDAEKGVFPKLVSLSMALPAPRLFHHSLSEIDAWEGATGIFTDYLSSCILPAILQGQHQDPKLAHFSFDGDAHARREFGIFVQRCRSSLVSLRAPPAIFSEIMKADKDGRQPVLHLPQTENVPQHDEAQWVAYPKLRYLRILSHFRWNEYYMTLGTGSGQNVTAMQLARSCPMLEVLWLYGARELQLTIDAQFPHLRVLVLTEQLYFDVGRTMLLGSINLPVLQELYLLGTENVVWQGTFESLRIFVSQMSILRETGDFFDDKNYPIMPRVQEIQLPYRRKMALEDYRRRGIQAPVQFRSIRPDPLVNNAMRLPAGAIVHVDKAALTTHSCFTGPEMQIKVRKTEAQWIADINQSLVASGLSLISPCGSCSAPNSGMFNAGLPENAADAQKLDKRRRVANGKM